MYFHNFLLGFHNRLSGSGATARKEHRQCRPEKSAMPPRTRQPHTSQDVTDISSVDQLLRYATAAQLVPLEEQRLYPRKDRRRSGPGYPDPQRGTDPVEGAEWLGAPDHPPATRAGSDHRRADPEPTRRGQPVIAGPAAGRGTTRRGQGKTTWRGQGKHPGSTHPAELDQDNTHRSASRRDRSPDAGICAGVGVHGRRQDGRARRRRRHP